MPDIIHLLPDAIANQIAAGEVVQRPASAVKELLENALDAGASRITLVVREAGRSLIQVMDNGSGMSETDARMSLERHATSKIRAAEDLFRIRSMGFRGEALASLAAVSQLEMKTRLAAAELGTWLVVEGSEVKRQEPVACEAGTSIAIRNLFFNIPARRNFLKSNTVELRHIVEEFQRVALAHPEVAFQVVNGDEVMFDLAPERLSHRIVSLFGKAYQTQLAPVREETAQAHIEGYIGRPQAAKRTRGDQYFFVNRRFVRNAYLHHAVMTAFEGLLPPDHFPFYVLMIDLDPRHIDVNVHPTKTEIKFDDERAVYALVLASVRQALSKHNLAPSLDFQADINLMDKIHHGESRSQSYFEERFFRPPVNPSAALFQDGVRTPVPDPRAVAQVEGQPEAPREEIRTADAIFQLHRQYVVCAIKSGLMIIDQQAAHERILYEQFLARLKGTPGASQQSLFPQPVEFSAGDFALILEIMPELQQLGFDLEVFGKTALLVRGLPPGAGSPEKALLDGLLEQFKQNQATLRLPLAENITRALAVRMSIKPGHVLSVEEMKALAASLWSCHNPNFSPAGRPTFFIFDNAKIDACFTS